MNTPQRFSQASPWLLAALCLCSQLGHAAGLEDGSPPVMDGPFLANVASVEPGDGAGLPSTQGTGQDWTSRTRKHHVGLSIGRARFNLPCIEGMVCRRNGRAITLHAGGDLSQRLGFELAYMRMSNMAHEGNTIRVRGVNVNLLGEVPLASRMTLTGRLGTNYAWTRMDMPTAGGVVTGKAHGLGLSYGVGLNWHISERWAASTDLNRHDFKFATGRDAVDTASLSLRYRY